VEAASRGAAASVLQNHDFQVIDRLAALRRSLSFEDYMKLVSTANVKQFENSNKLGTDLMAFWSEMCLAHPSMALGQIVARITGSETAILFSSC
jgi:hypothetical protein